MQKRQDRILCALSKRHGRKHNIYGDYIIIVGTNKAEPMSRLVYDSINHKTLSEIRDVEIGKMFIL